MKALLISISILFILMISGCGLLDSDQPDSNRINFGESIDGVRIDDNVKTVLQKLGKPDSYSYADAGGSVLYYTKGMHAGLTICISPKSDDKVKLMEIDTIYCGKNKDGIGIGSLRDDVINRLGKPASSSVTGKPGYYADFYAFKNNTALIMYTTYKIKSIMVNPPSARPCKK